MSVKDDQLSVSLVNIRSEHTEELVDIPISELIVDIAANRRDTKGTYEKDYPDMAALIQSMTTFGWMPGKRVLVSKRANGTKRVLQGHRRTIAAGFAGLTSIPCQVFTGLTPDQETAVIVDGGEAPIGKIGHFREVQMLMQTGLVGRNPIAIKTGLLTKKKPIKPRTEVQEYMELVELPKIVQDIWIDGQRNDPVPFTVDATRRRELYMAMLRDRQGLTLDANGTKVQAYDNGIQRVGTWTAVDGPEFKATFNQLLEKGKTVKQSQRDKAVNAAGLEGMGTSILQPDVSDLFLGLSGKKDYSSTLRKITGTMERHAVLVNLIKDVKNPLVRLFVHGAAVSDEREYNEAMAQVVKLVTSACDDFVELNDVTLPKCAEPEVATPPAIEVPSSEAPASEEVPSEEVPQVSAEAPASEVSAEAPASEVSAEAPASEEVPSEEVPSEEVPSEVSEKPVILSNRERKRQSKAKSK
jgi:hypothetical protein